MSIEFHKQRLLFSFLLVLIFAVLPFHVQAGDKVIIINSSGYDRPHYYSDYGNNHRLRNKHYFESRYRRSYGDRYYRNRGYRINSYRNNYRYNNRNYYRSNRSYCPN